MRMRIIWAPSPGCGRGFSARLLHALRRRAPRQQAEGSGPRRRSAGRRHAPRQPRFAVGPFDVEFMSASPIRSPEPTALADRNAAGTRPSFRRLEDRPHADDSAATSTKSACARSAADGVDGARSATRPMCCARAFAVGSATSRQRSRHRRGSAGTRRHHHLRLTCRPASLGRAGGPRPGREVVIAGRAMRNTIEAARAWGYLRDAGETSSKRKPSAICRPTRSCCSAPAARASRAPPSPHRRGPASADRAR